MLQAAARITTVSKKPDGFFTESCLSCRALTVKLRGRPTTPDERRGRTLSSRARGAKQTTPHGPLQRLLGGRLQRPEYRDCKRHEQRNPSSKAPPAACGKNEGYAQHY